MAKAGRKHRFTPDESLEVLFNQLRIGHFVTRTGKQEIKEGELDSMIVLNQRRCHRSLDLRVSGEDRDPPSYTCGDDTVYTFWFAGYAHGKVWVATQVGSGNDFAMEEYTIPDLRRELSLPQP